LKYAHAKLAKDELDAILWIHGETALSIQQSFSDTAVRLRLLEVKPQNHDENRAILLHWLQRTSKFPPFRFVFL
jgi:hypothetical protein